MDLSFDKNESCGSGGILRVVQEMLTGRTFRLRHRTRAVPYSLRAPEPSAPKPLLSGFMTWISTKMKSLVSTFRPEPVKENQHVEGIFVAKPEASLETDSSGMKDDSNAIKDDGVRMSLGDRQGNSLTHNADVIEDLIMTPDFEVASNVVQNTDYHHDPDVIWPTRFDEVKGIGEEMNSSSVNDISSMDLNLDSVTVNEYNYCSNMGSKRDNKVSSYMNAHIIDVGDISSATIDVSSLSVDSQIADEVTLNMQHDNFEDAGNMNSHSNSNTFVSRPSNSSAEAANVNSHIMSNADVNMLSDSSQEDANVNSQSNSNAGVNMPSDSSAEAANVNSPIISNAGVNMHSDSFQENANVNSHCNSNAGVNMPSDRPEEAAKVNSQIISNADVNMLSDNSLEDANVNSQSNSNAGVNMSSDNSAEAANVNSQIISNAGVNMHSDSFQEITNVNSHSNSNAGVNMPSDSSAKAANVNSLIISNADVNMHSDGTEDDANVNSHIISNTNVDTDSEKSEDNVNMQLHHIFNAGASTDFVNIYEVTVNMDSDDSADVPADMDSDDSSEVNVNMDSDDISEINVNMDSDDSSEASEDMDSDDSSKEQSSNDLQEFVANEDLAGIAGVVPSATLGYLNDWAGIPLAFVVPVGSDVQLAPGQLYFGNPNDYAYDSSGDEDDPDYDYDEADFLPGPMTMEDIVKLPLRPVLELPNPNQQCDICLKDYEPGDCLKIAPCSHEFHRACLDIWLGVKQVCPKCRKFVEV